MSSVFLRRLSRWQAETEREQIGDLYAEAHQDVPGVRALSREEFVRAFVDHDLGQPGFDMVVASDPKLVGCAYGFQVSDVPLGIAELAAGGHVFRVAGLMVTPRRQRQAVATRAQKELLARAGASLGLALLEPGNTPARAAFQSWGWVKAGQLAPHDGAAPLEAWARLRH
ncbi:GNAT family N-acetyltransferase [Streptomyces sp. NBC_01803]|uniref:GNAT family N-acetyltransferase n=1 Tax=Streptomyces sp. NBC_01803 TaxID=2975946 RepID=UPI002DDA0584|nr:GNAT family N-acetyltransferase [Streptomyces sp. NBC_01803]WSA44304.1 GNAT family N-acetyltransferase [Streptomyces sp. NBC_01803]